MQIGDNRDNHDDVLVALCMNTFSSIPKYKYATHNIPYSPQLTEQHTPPSVTKFSLLHFLSASSGPARSPPIGMQAVRQVRSESHRKRHYNLLRRLVTASLSPRSLSQGTITAVHLSQPKARGRRLPPLLLNT